MAEDCNSNQCFHDCDRLHDFSLAGIDFVEDSMSTHATSWNPCGIPLRRLVDDCELYSTVFRADLHRIKPAYSGCCTYQYMVSCYATWILPS